VYYAPVAGVGDSGQKDIEKSLVDSMGGTPEQSKTQSWEEVQQRWEEKLASQYSPLGSWQAARNKYARLDSRKNLREWTLPNPDIPIPEEVIA
jgi:hypothetical protein